MHPVGPKNQRDTVAQNGNLLMNRFDEFNRGCTLNTKNMNQYISIYLNARCSKKMSQHVPYSYDFLFQTFSHDFPYVSQMFSTCCHSCFPYLSHIQSVFQTFSIVFLSYSIIFQSCSMVFPNVAMNFPMVFPWFSPGGGVVRGCHSLAD